MGRKAAGDTEVTKYLSCSRVLRQVWEVQCIQIDLKPRILTQLPVNILSFLITDKRINLIWYSVSFSILKCGHSEMFTVTQGGQTT